LLPLSRRFNRLGRPVTSLWITLTPTSTSLDHRPVRSRLTACLGGPRRANRPRYKASLFP
jgi:hypothetical protein